MPKRLEGLPSKAALRQREYRARVKLKKAEAKLKARPDLPPTPADPAAALLEFSKSLVIPPGHPNAGKQMTIPGFGIDFLRDALTHRESLMCIGRKNGKSAIVGVYLLARLAGPLATEGYRAGVASVTKEKAQELWIQVRDIAQASGLAGIEVTRSPRQVKGPYGGVVDFLSADASSGHASGFDDSICDELGLLKERDRDLVNGMRSAISARNGRFMALSIMGDAPFTKEIVSRRDAPQTAVHYYAADENCAIDDPAAWAAANPGIAAGIKSESYMADEAARCLSVPADELSFRAFDLNQPTAPSRTLVCALSDWQACCVAELPDRRGDVVLAIDIGGSNSMTAAVAIWPETGRVESWAAFGGIPDLKKRGRADGVADQYVQMHGRGELEVFDGCRVTPVAQFIERVASDLAGERIAAAGADRYRRAEVQQALSEAGVRWPMVWRGTGASSIADGSFDVRSFQRMARAGEFRVRESLLWTMAILESEIRYDASGNPALDKRRQQSRIDVLQAGTIAAGLAAKLKAVQSKGPGLSLVVAG